MYNVGVQLPKRGTHANQLAAVRSFVLRPVPWIFGHDWQDALGKKPKVHGMWSMHRWLIATALLRKTRIPTIVQLGWQSPARKKASKKKQRVVFMLIFLAQRSFFRFQLLLICLRFMFIIVRPVRSNQNKRNKSGESQQLVSWRANLIDGKISNACVRAWSSFLIRLILDWDEKSERNHRCAIVFFKRLS